MRGHVRLFVLAALKIGHCRTKQNMRDLSEIAESLKKHEAELVRLQREHKKNVEEAQATLEALCAKIKTLGKKPAK